jgi:UDP-glucose 4-epimerase
MRIIITGASGFLGSYVLRLLMEKKNLEIIPVTRKNILGWFKVTNYSQSPVGDVLIHLAENNDQKKVDQLDKEYQEESLFTINALLTKGYRRIVYSSSAILYGDKSIGAHFPSDRTYVHNLYARVKKMSELKVLKSPSGISVRPANIYGMGMSKNNVVSTILDQIHIDGELEVMDTSPVRDFIWVEDVAEGIVALATKPFKECDKGGVFNLGTGVGTSIGTLARIALEIAGKPHRTVVSRCQFKRQSSLILNFSDTTSNCGWLPNTSLKQGITCMLRMAKKI